jgi:hypothetical protein
MPKDTVIIDPKNPDPKQIEALLNSREPSETAKAILRAVRVFYSGNILKNKN